MPFSALKHGGRALVLPQINVSEFDDSPWEALHVGRGGCWVVLWEAGKADGHEEGWDGEF